MADHFMIDLETMSTASDAAILSIGVQPFDPRGIDIDPAAGLLINVDLQACMTAGLRVDASTIMWWLAQSDDARAALYGKMSDAVLLSVALQELVAFGQRSGGWSWAKVWSNGAAFDIPILEHAFRVCRRDIPWGYNNVLDVRTMKWLAPDVPKVAPIVAHNALSDAQAQAVYVQRCLAAIKAGDRIEITGTPGPDQTIGEALEIIHNRSIKHPDDQAVDLFAVAMKDKLAIARDKGRGGWEDKEACTQADLSQMLRGHVEKGDPVDVANFCMMLQQRGERIA